MDNMGRQLSPVENRLFRFGLLTLKPGSFAHYTSQLSYWLCRCKVQSSRFRGNAVHSNKPKTSTKVMDMLPVVVVHGGAGSVPRERSDKASSGVCSAAQVGYVILQRGGSSMDAVVEAVTQMENNPVFNAGCGSVLTNNGEVEMDAIVMDGKTLASGAVSAVRNIANPVQLARLVMDKTSHSCLTAHGANQFARAMDVPEVPQESLITEYSRMRWRKNLAPDANPVECQMGKMGTVGAVAVDLKGNVACATSTGGLLNQMEGRVGDTPCIGCGGYADNQVGAVSTTGHGEAIMKVTLARLILFHMEQATGHLHDGEHIIWGEPVGIASRLCYK
ncbi:isoaspartyl peptidase/L-asparaginase isoform X3 [Dunckerocampus dactyliophorus]|uniref:isoaspartyl peptidase/L-asparaginase isoform X3 n=1 Tax=Dunckerocampus dactyliophorus TaxID=161453 RepID=UPI0024063AD7|nr:isoaspartyl peptidase/L-asparaginase isoform X3 [Dunckerocampus dactyliophorus]